MLHIYDRFEQTFEGFGLAAIWEDVIDPHINWRLNGEHTLTFQYPADAVNATYLVGDNFIRYKDNIFVIRDVEPTHDFDGKIVDVMCESIISELMDKHIREINFENNTLQEALDIIFQGTRFRADASEVAGLVDVEEEVEDALEAFKLLLDERQAEYEPPGLPDEDGFFSVIVKPEIGENRGKVIKYRQDLTGIRQHVDHKNVITRLYPYGREGLTIEDAEDNTSGLPYIDAPNIDDYPRPKERSITWGNVQSPDTLYERAIEYMENERPYEPETSYEVDFADLTDHPDFDDIAEIQKGDTVTVDDEEEMGIMVEARAIEFDEPLKAPENTRIILANFEDDITDNMMSYDRTNRTVERVTVGNRVVTDRLDGAINALQNQIQASGAFESAEVVEDGGMIFANTNEESPDFGALYIGPGLMAISNERDDGGNWIWKSFGTGEGFTADLITAGTMLFDRLQGGEMTLGGQLDGDGLMRLLNNQNETIITMNREGIQLADGARILNASGIISVFQYISTGNVWGWSEIGIVHTGTDLYPGEAQINIPIPDNFEIEKATLRIEAMPAFYYDNDGNQEWRQSRNLKLYTTEGDDAFFDYPFPGTHLVVWGQRDGEQDITNDVLGVSEWSPPQTERIVSIEGDITSHLESGEENAFYVSTTDTPNASNWQNNHGLGRIVVIVEGYVRAEGTFY